MTLHILDPHIHLFDLKLGDYHWLKGLRETQKRKIARSFTLQDLHLSGNLSLAGFVHIEAGFNNQQPSLEIAHIEKQLLSQVSKDRELCLIAKTAGSVDLTLRSDEFISQVDAQKSFSSLASVRHILGSDALDILGRADTVNNFRYLAAQGIIFELQMPLHDHQSVSAFISILHKVPNLKVVINHAGSVPFHVDMNAAKNNYAVAKLDTAEAFEQWQINTQKLSEFQQISIKCSGWEMTHQDYTLDSIAPSVRHLAACFGHSRVMFASNFPLVLYTCSYQGYWESMQSLAAICDLQAEQVCFENAHRIYGF